MELTYLEQLRLGDIERRQLELPPAARQHISGSAARHLFAAAVGALFIHAQDDIEFLLKIVREHERPH